MIIVRGNQTNSEKTCPNVTLSTTYPTLTNPGANQGLSGEAGD
jgi:hypothetical protein